MNRQEYDEMDQWEYQTEMRTRPMVESPGWLWVLHTKPYDDKVHYYAFGSRNSEPICGDWPALEIGPEAHEGDGEFLCQECLAISASPEFKTENTQ